MQVILHLEGSKSSHTKWTVASIATLWAAHSSHQEGVGVVDVGTFIPLKWWILDWYWPWCLKNTYHGIVGQTYDRYIMIYWLARLRLLCHTHLLHHPFIWQTFDQVCQWSGGCSFGRLHRSRIGRDRLFTLLCLFEMFVDRMLFWYLAWICLRWMEKMFSKWCFIMVESKKSPYKHKLVDSLGLGLLLWSLLQLLLLDFLVVCLFCFGNKSSPKRFK